MLHLLRWSCFTDLKPAVPFRMSRYESYTWNSNPQWVYPDSDTSDMFRFPFSYSKGSSTSCSKTIPSWSAKHGRATELANILVNWGSNHLSISQSLVDLFHSETYWNHGQGKVLSSKLTCKVLDLVIARYSRCTRVATKSSPSTVRVPGLGLEWLAIARFGSLT